MLKVFEKWFDVDVDEWIDEGVWNKIWGIKMNYEREFLGREFGFLLCGWVCFYVSFLFVIVINVVLMVMWFVMCVLNSVVVLVCYWEELFILLLLSGSGNLYDL